MVDTYISDNTGMFLSSAMIAMTVVFLVVTIILMVSYYKLFEKNGEAGYKAIIPIYNLYILMKIVGMNPLSILLLIIPFVNLFVLALLNVRLASKYNKSALFAIGLLFFPFICYPILAFSKNRETVKEETAEPIEKKQETIEEKPQEETILCPNCGMKLPSHTNVCFVCNTNLKEEPVHNEEPLENEKEEISTENVSIKEETPSFENIQEKEIEKEEQEPDSNFLLTEPEIQTHEPEEPELKGISIDRLNIEETPDLKEEKKESNPYKNMEKEVQQEPLHSKPKGPTKTLDEILRMNSDLYTSSHSEKEEDKEDFPSFDTPKMDDIESLDFMLDMERGKSPSHIKENFDYDKKETPVDITDEVEKLLQTIDEISKIEKEKEERKEAIEDSRVCKKCGSIIPRFTQKCLLCGYELKK